MRSMRRLRFGLAFTCLSMSGWLAAGRASAAPAAPVVVTVPQLCAQGQQFVKGSAKYLALPPAQRRSADMLTNAACSLLAAPKQSPALKAALIAGYKSVVTALAARGWLTGAQASTLKSLANQVDDLRPSAVISNPGSITTGVVVSFNGSQSTDPDGTVVAYAWTWGDGSPNGSGVNPSHTYATAGSYTVKLIVTDDKGAQSGAASLPVVVVDPPNIEPTAVIADPGLGSAGVEMDFDGEESTDPDGIITAYTWTWGDGSPDGSGVTPLHTYVEPGTYTVTLVVTDDMDAESDPATIEVEIGAASPGGPCDSTNLALTDTLGGVIASALVLPAPSATAVCTLLQVVPEPDAALPPTFPALQIDATDLFGPGSTAIPISPTGYTRITNAVRFDGAIPSNKVRMCFTLPSNTASFKSVRVAYFDTAPNINRWVFLTTAVNSLTDQACMTKGLYRPIPATFALFGQN